MSRKVYDHSQTSHHHVFSMKTTYSSFSPTHWARNHRVFQPHIQFRLHDWMLKSAHTNCWLLSTAQWWKELSEEGNEIFNYSQLLCLCYKNVHASVIFNYTLKIWWLKRDNDKIYAIFSLFMTQQEEDCLNNQPTSGTAGFKNTVIDSILDDKRKI